MTVHIAQSTAVPAVYTGRLCNGQSLDSSVSTVTCLRAEHSKNRTSIPRMDNRFISFPNWGPSGHPFSWYRGPLPGGKGGGGPLTPSSVEARSGAVALGIATGPAVQRCEHGYTHPSSLHSWNTLGPFTATWLEFRAAGGWCLLPQSYEMKAYLDFDHQTAVRLLTSVHASLFRGLLYRSEYNFILYSEYRDL